MMFEIARGSTLAFQTLYQKFGNKMYHYFLKMTNQNQHTSEDLLQELFIQIHLNAHKYNPEFQLSTWMYAIASNLVKNANRKALNQQRLLNQELIEKDDYEMDNQQVLEKKQLTNLIYQFAQNIDADAASMLYLRYQEQFQLSEIADIMNLPLGTVKSKLHSITKKIATKFNIQNHAS
jgi:RNA polymerase sigma-70 factor (ECF subfamily)